MALPTPFEHLPLRMAIGAFILNSGLTKRGADAETAGGLHQAASGTYPFLAKLEPQKFLQLLSSAEIALGAALLAPVVPSRIAGSGLTAFAGGLLGMYVKNPGMRQPGSLRPSAEGTALAKDVWMLGAGLTLVALGRRPRHHAGTKAGR